MSFIIVLVAMLAFMYLLLIRPQRKQQQRHKMLVESLQPGAEVITAGGIYGDVVEVEADRVVLEIAEDVHIEVAKRAIATVVPPEPDLDEPGDLNEPDELEAAAEEEPVNPISEGRR